MPEAKCIDCGAKFVSKRSTSVRCPDCQKARLRKLKHESRQRARQRGRAYRVSSGDIKMHRCPFCGTPTVNKTYCTDCLRTGFANVHKTFGATNGWDSPKHQRPTIADGIRGNMPTGAININKDFPMRIRFY